LVTVTVDGVDTESTRVAVKLNVPLTR